MLPFGELLQASSDEETAFVVCKRLLLTWVNSSDGSELPALDVQFNDMHVFGQGLAHVMSKFDPLEIRDSQTEDLGSICQNTCMKGIELQNCDWMQCLDVLMYVQTIIGRSPNVDVGFLLALVMQRFGDLLSVQCQFEDVVPSHYESTNDGWHELTVATRIHGINTLYCLMRIDHLLVNAAKIHIQDKEVDKYMQELSRYHHEASLHEFYNISIIADCTVGSILTYKHTFKDQFNDCSQVVYYNCNGNYNRQRQIPLSDIKSVSACPLNVIPLLIQLKPDMPVLYEHTGACTNEMCSRAPWTWVVLNRHVFLCDDKHNVYVANSIYELFAFVMESVGDVPMAD